MPTVWSEGRAFTLPDNPNVGDTVVIGNRIWTWNGTQWVVTPVTGSPAGADTQIQWNHNGAFGASAGLTFDSANTRLGVLGQDPAITLFDNTGNNINLTMVAVSNLTTNPDYVPFADSALITTSDDSDLFLSPSGALTFVPGAAGVYAVPITTGLGGYAFTVDLASANVGIREVNPAYPLDIDGDCNLSAGSVYRIGGVPLSTGGSQTPWTSNIDGANYRLDNAGAIGIGGTAATSGDPRIRIVGTNQDGLRCESTQNTGYAGIALQNDAGTTAFISLMGSASSGGLRINPGANTPVNIFCGGSPLITLIPATRYMGINNGTPAYRLDVNGDCNLSAGSVYRINGVPLALGGSQTPWTSDIDGAGFQLGNVNAIGLGVTPPAWGNTSSWLFIQNQGIGIRLTNSTPSDASRLIGSLQFEDLSNTQTNKRVADIQADTLPGGTPGNRGGRILFSIRGDNASSASQFCRFTQRGLAIRTAADPNYALDVAGDINILDPGGTNGWAFRINGVPLAFVNAAGNVGIGTTTPSSTLTIAGTLPTVEIRDGGYLQLRPPTNDFDMRLQSPTPYRLDVLSGASLGTPIASFFHGGNVGIGTTTPQNRLHVIGGISCGTNAVVADIGDISASRDSNSATGFLFLGTGGAHLLGFDGTNYVLPFATLFVNGVEVPSDIRLKENVTPVTDDPLVLLSSLNFVRFEHNGLGGTIKGKRGIGLVAQELESVLPEAVGRSSEDFLSINYHPLYMHALRAIVELAARIKRLEEN